METIAQGNSNSSIIYQQRNKTNNNNPSHSQHTDTHTNDHTQNEEMQQANSKQAVRTIEDTPKHTQKLTVCSDPVDICFVIAICLFLYLFNFFVDTHLHRRIILHSHTFTTESAEPYEGSCYYTEKPDVNKATAAIDTQHLKGKKTKPTNKTVSNRI